MSGRPPQEEAKQEKGQGTETGVGGQPGEGDVLGAQERGERPRARKKGTGSGQWTQGLSPISALMVPPLPVCPITSRLRWGSGKQPQGQLHYEAQPSASGQVARVPGDATRPQQTPPTPSSQMRA